MKKIICFVLCMVVMLSTVACGGPQLIDTTYTFEHAQITMPDGSVVKGRVDSWKDYENSDMMQVKIDGKTYLTHSANVVLISE